ncbi:type IV secretion system protein VirB10 [Burkholderia gladioli pv. gladioli]|uniref:Bacterial conjugation TrbI-like family protein n=1 Tax=Burkholderia gladioli TaxID=28095 RepID=A0A095F265_BURGA|nr:type IV secretion system protein VirB10 [Burkholderia gladioli]AJW99486.1 bacterial conjugation TrbI-like family protein [Burkholderia gladioli]ASD80028.1 type IV secretion system protein VirB10 [Burkholderia gladioli pv. gladioli]AWY54725.1 type IV secretion system protein VirB10 [Burkholderia gladioli pv. gladioli]KGC11055.1 bacterial conjugation TrbI-like family protein [Burkholderia gladioli]MDJ1160309.1 type IV secretion system protein VirB10 [Burkholderia gladioli pv. gladioli]
MNEETPRNGIAPKVVAGGDPAKVTETINGDLANQPADRGMPELGQQGGRPRAWWLAPLVVVAVVIGGAVWTMHGFLERHDAAEKARRDAVQDQPSPGRVFSDGTVAASAVAAVPGSPVTASAAASAPVVAATPRTPVRTAPVRSYYDAPLLATGSTGGSNGPANAAAELAASTPGASPGATAVTVGPPQGSSPLAQALTPTVTPKARAGFLGNRSLVLAEGAKIDCVGDTAFDSTEAGISTCTVTKNVYSDDGHVVLIERGSQVNSEYRSNLAPGQKRVFILSARIKTPEGVTVETDSPAADALGRMGVGGYVNNHWSERIGAAMLLGMTQDAIGYFATRGGNSNGPVVFENTQQQGNDMASRVLDSTINIPPTLSQNQGAEFTIVVARDLDFSAVYALDPEGSR